MFTAETTITSSISLLPNNNYQLNKFTGNKFTAETTITSSTIISSVSLQPKQQLPAQ
jgi:hypothetical protein